jgi:hypothetical protein
MQIKLKDYFKESLDKRIIDMGKRGWELKSRGVRTHPNAAIKDLIIGYWAKMEKEDDDARIN